MISREQVVEELTRLTFGPRGGQDETVPDLPTSTYICGILYPRQDVLEQEPDDDAQVTVADLTEDRAAVDEPDPADPSLFHAWLPSSAGVSFLLTDPVEMDVEVSAARYLRSASGQGFRRAPHATERVRVPTDSGVGLVEVFGGDASVHVRARPRADGTLVTVALVNEVRLEGDSVVDRALASLYQVAMRIRPVSDQPSLLRPYPRALPEALVDAEERELSLQYSREPIFAIGHGCAASWSPAEEPVELCAEFMPRFSARDLRPRQRSEGQTLSAATLAALSEDGARLATTLRAYFAGYTDWIAARELDAARLTGHDSVAAERILSRCRDVERGIEAGIALLEKDDLARRAFGLAQRAVADQAPKKDLEWYAFQLAFQLVAIPSAVDELHPERALVELIWFPTGGGKTEAYFGLAAFTLFCRRLMLGERGAGVGVITRYTLQLLTKQQFARASRLLCACERLRRGAPAELGSEPMTVGLWIGQDVVPGTIEKALESDWELPLAHCPACGSPIDKKCLARDGGRLRLICASDCDFPEGLPVVLVDENLYQNPPSFLVATVDKFAGFAWSDRPAALFGDQRHAPPSLVIQDELHLVEGPLGSVMGGYEAAFDVTMASRGAPAKLVASTATIRNESAQVAGLFARSSRRFPPGGLTVKDSWFAEEAASEGRLFVGMMAPGQTRETAIVHVASALLQSSASLNKTRTPRGSFSTLVTYHGTIADAAHAVSLTRQDVRQRLLRIAGEDEDRILEDAAIVELTSRIGKAEVQRAFRRLESNDDDEPIDLIAATNMVSVGLDIGHLDLMLVDGQPRSTAEYIQATSRVGRSSPGLVVCLFRPTRPRDRSHYEGFSSYHRQLYRWVEPVSVTPFSIPARRRTLHAALVIAIRHGVPLPDAKDFDPDDPRVAELLDRLRVRICAADASEADASARDLSDLISTWAELTRGKLIYNGNNPVDIPLLRRYDRRPRRGWPTLDSMRSVDAELAVEVLP